MAVVRGLGGDLLPLPRNEVVDRTHALLRGDGLEVLGHELGVVEQLDGEVRLPARRRRHGGLPLRQDRAGILIGPEALVGDHDVAGRSVHCRAGVAPTLQDVGEGPRQAGRPKLALAAQVGVHRGARVLRRDGLGAGPVPVHRVEGPPVVPRAGPAGAPVDRIEEGSGRAIAGAAVALRVGERAEDALAAGGLPGDVVQGPVVAAGAGPAGASVIEIEERAAGTAVVLDEGRLGQLLRDGLPARIGAPDLLRRAGVAARAGPAFAAEGRIEKGARRAIARQRRSPGPEVGRRNRAAPAVLVFRACRAGHRGLAGLGYRASYRQLRLSRNRDRDQNSRRHRNAETKKPSWGTHRILSLSLARQARLSGRGGAAKRFYASRGGMPSNAGRIRGTGLGPVRRCESGRMTGSIGELNRHNARNRCYKSLNRSRRHA